MMAEQEYDYSPSFYEGNRRGPYQNKGDDVSHSPLKDCTQIGDSWERRDLKWKRLHYLNNRCISNYHAREVECLRVMGTLKYHYDVYPNDEIIPLMMKNINKSDIYKGQKIMSAKYVAGYCFLKYCDLNRKYIELNEYCQFLGIEKGKLVRYGLKYLEINPMYSSMNKKCQIMRLYGVFSYFVQLFNVEDKNAFFAQSKQRMGFFIKHGTGKKYALIFSMCTVYFEMTDTKIYTICAAMHISWARLYTLYEKYKEVHNE